MDVVGFALTCEKTGLKERPLSASLLAIQVMLGELAGQKGPCLTGERLGLAGRCHPEGGPAQISARKQMLVPNEGASLIGCLHLICIKPVNLINSRSRDPSLVGG